MTPLLRSDPALPTTPGADPHGRPVTSSRLALRSLPHQSRSSSCLTFISKVYVCVCVCVFISHSPGPKLKVPFRREKTPRRNILGALQLFISEAVESSLPWGMFPRHSPAVIPRQCPLADEGSSHWTTCSCLLAGHLPWGYYATQMLTSELAHPHCPHFCLDTGLWRLISPSSEVIHTCQQL